MKKTTAWEKIGDWYDKVVGKEGSLYHKEVIFPKLIPMLNQSQSLLDCACGQGVLSRLIDEKIEYMGLDLSSSLIGHAKGRSNHTFKKQDICKPFDLKKTFSTAICLLAFQNLEDPESFLKNAQKHLEMNGTLYLILNHPCFRIPRQSSWGIDEKKKTQYRRVERYMSQMEIPLQASPSKKEKSLTIRTFHHSISSISTMLASNNFVIAEILEWCSNKTSSGKHARMENRAREEFPLFMTIVAKKV